MHIKRKLKNTSGLTQLELIITILIVLLISSMVVTGINLAVRQRKNVEMNANADLMLSTCVTSLRTKLGEATEVEAASRMLTYRNAYTQATARIYSDYEGIKVDEAGGTLLLVNSISTGEKLLVKYSNVSVSGNIVTFENLRVESGGVVYASLETLHVRVQDN